MLPLYTFFPFFIYDSLTRLGR